MAVDEQGRLPAVGLMPCLPGTISYTETSRSSRWNLRRKRSSNAFCSMSRARVLVGIQRHRLPGLHIYHYLANRVGEPHSPWSWNASSIKAFNDSWHVTRLREYSHGLTNAAARAGPWGVLIIWVGSTCLMDTTSNAGLVDSGLRCGAVDCGGAKRTPVSMPPNREIFSAERMVRIEFTPLGRVLKLDLGMLSCFVTQTIAIPNERSVAPQNTRFVHSTE